LRQKAFRARDELLLGSGLTVIAGALDAYAYLEHGAVFAGLQAGNLVLLGINFGQLQLAEMGRYLTALLAFVIGIGLSRGLQRYLEKRQRDNQNVGLWATFGLLIIVLATTGVVPDGVATALLSLTAAVELQLFQATMGLETVLNVTATLLNGTRLKDREARQKALDALTTVGSFVLGAVLVAAFSKLLAGYTVLVPILVVAGLIFWQYEQNHRRKWKH